jgi:hypothetical protein
MNDENVQYVVYVEGSEPIDEGVEYTGSRERAMGFADAYCRTTDLEVSVARIVNGKADHLITFYP